jgi:hypothetical protein
MIFQHCCILAILHDTFRLVFKFVSFLYASVFLKAAYHEAMSAVPAALHIPHSKKLCATPIEFCSWLWTCIH